MLKHHLYSQLFILCIFFSGCKMQEEVKNEADKNISFSYDSTVLSL